MKLNVILMIAILAIALLLGACTKSTIPDVKLEPKIISKDVKVGVFKSVNRTLVLRLREGKFDYDPLIAKKGDGFILTVKYAEITPTSRFFVEGYNISVPFTKRGEAFINITADKTGTFVFGETSSNATGKLIVFEDKKETDQ